MKIKQFAFALGATLCIAVPSFAQSIVPAMAQDDAGASEGGGGGGGAGGGAGGGNKEKMKAMVQACRKDAKGQGLKPNSHEFHQAVADCVVKQKPGMATVMKCRVEAMDKGMKPGSDDMKSYVKDCRKKSG